MANRSIVLGLCLVLAGTALFGQQNVQEEQDYTFAYGLYGDGKYQLAFDRFTEFVKTWPESAVRIDAEYFAAECLFRQGNLTDAVIGFERFRRRYPESKLYDDAGFREGEAYYRQEDFPRAFDTFTAVLRKVPESDLAHELAYWAGESAFRDGRSADAIRYYTISYDHYPNGRIRDYALFSIGYVHEMDGRYEEAEDLYSTFLRLFPKSDLRSAVLTRIGACLSGKGDYAGTVQWFASMDDGPDADNAAERLFYTGEAQYKLGKYADAERTYRTFLAAYPENRRAAQVRYSLGWCFVEQKKYSEAVTVFDSLGRGTGPVAEAARFRKGMALRLDGKTEEARIVFTRILVDDEKGEYTDNATFELGMSAYSNGLYKSALGYFERIAGKHPDSDILADSYFMSGETLLKLESPAEAAGAFAAAVAADSLPGTGRSNALFRYAYSLYRSGNFSIASNNFRQFLREFPGDIRKPDALVWLGESCTELRKYSDAVIVYNQALVSTTEPALLQDALYGLGWANYLLQNYTESESVFDRLANDYKGGIHDMDANVRLGDARFAQKKFKSAARTYRYASKMYPSHRLAPYALLQLANAAHRSGDGPAGIATLRGMLSKYPDSEYADKARFSLGWMYFIGKDYKVAVSELTNVFIAFPASPLAANAKYTIADCYYNQGDYKKAESAYRRILEEHPDSPVVSDALDGIGQSLRMQGKNTDAAVVRENWLKANPESKVADEIAFANARKEYLDGNLSGATLSLQSFIRTYPRSQRYQEAFFLLGRTQLESGNPDRASKTFRETVELDRLSNLAFDAELEIAGIASEGQDYPAAITRYDSLLTRHPSGKRGAAILYRRGITRRSAGRIQEAEQDFVRAIALEDDEVTDPARIEQARIAAARGSLDSAVQVLRSIAGSRKDETGARAQYSIGDILFDTGKNPEAEKALLRVEYVYPDAGSWIPRSLLLLGKLYDRQDQSDKAIATFRKIVDKFAGTTEAQEAGTRLERYK